MGVFDAPRAVLRAVAGDGFVEMDRSGRDAQCCGTSGFVYCDAASRRLQAERLGAARATGSRTLVTSCPKCLIHFSCAQADLRRGGADGAQLDLQIVDLTVVAASRLVAGVPAEGGPAPRAADGGAP